MSPLNVIYKTKNSLYVYVVSFFISLFFIFYFSFTTNAVSISPLKHMVVVDPGMSQDIAFTITNDTDQEKKYRMDVDGFAVDPKSGRSIFGQTSPALDWISFVSGDTFTLGPSQQREVVASVRVPSGVVPQTYYIGVFAQEMNQSETNVRVDARVGTLVFLTVGGVVTEDLDVDYVVPASFVVFGKPTIDIGLHNKGTVVAPYVGELIITTMGGQIVYRAPLSEGVDRVYAGMKKQDSFFIDTLSWRAIGPLTATVVIEYGIEKKIVSSSTTFWFMPPIAWGLVAVFLCVCISFFMLLHRRARIV